MNRQFPYFLRISKKAKHVRFQVSVEKGLEVVIPRPSQVPLLVEQNSQWIERAFQKAKASGGLIDPIPIWRMPEEITLLALDVTWSVLSEAGCKMYSGRRSSEWVAIVLSSKEKPARIDVTGLRRGPAAPQTASR
jgi:hypothetical protein